MENYAAKRRADYLALHADSDQCLQLAFDRFSAAYDQAGMK